MAWKHFFLISALIISVVKFIDWRWPSISKRLSNILVDYYFALEEVKPSLIPYRLGSKFHDWISEDRKFLLSLSFGFILFIFALIHFGYTIPSGTIREILVGPLQKYRLDINETPWLGSQILALFWGMTYGYVSVLISLTITQHLFGIIKRNKSCLIGIIVIILDIIAAFFISIFCFRAALNPLLSYNWAFPNGSLLHSISSFSGLGALSISVFYFLLFFVSIAGRFFFAMPGIKGFTLGTIDRIVSTAGGPLTALVVLLTAILGLMKYFQKAFF